jgi:hypothetical protein
MVVVVAVVVVAVVLVLVVLVVVLVVLVVLVAVRLRWRLRSSHQHSSRCRNPISLVRKSRGSFQQSIETSTADNTAKLRQEQQVEVAIDQGSGHLLANRGQAVEAAGSNNRGEALSTSSGRTALYPQYSTMQRKMQMQQRKRRARTTAYVLALGASGCSRAPPPRHHPGLTGRVAVAGHLVVAGPAGGAGG